MSVVGVDLGSLNTVIAVARNRGVDVVSTPNFVYTSVLWFMVGFVYFFSHFTNSWARSQMKSPTEPPRKTLPPLTATTPLQDREKYTNPLDRPLVGFGPKSRYIGEAAKNQEVSNLKNTVASFTRLAGRTLNDPDVEEEKSFVSAPLVDVNGQVGAEVNYLGKKEKFTATQITAAFLTKIKQTASAELKLPVSDVVLSVPVWFTDAQRRAILDASEIPRPHNTVCGSR